MYNPMFLHSDLWRDFQERAGVTVCSLEGADNPWAMRVTLPLGLHYWYSPYASSYEPLITCGKSSGAVFVKCEPMQEDTAVYAGLKDRGFVCSIRSLQPQKTSIVSLSADQETMLSGMNKKARYNIRLAMRKGVVVDTNGTMDEFWALMQETTERDGFHSHTRSYYEELLKTQGVSLYVARIQQTPAACAIVLTYKGRGVYLHGASSYQYRSYMPSSVLQWRIMVSLADKGVKEYDLWGIDDKKWAGVTRFKRRLGGTEIGYGGSYDFAVRPILYRLYIIKQKML